MVGKKGSGRLVRNHRKKETLYYYLIQDGCVCGGTIELKHITDLPMYDSGAGHTLIIKNSVLIYDSKTSKKSIWEATGKYPPPLSGRPPLSGSPTYPPKFRWGELVRIKDTDMCINTMGDVWDRDKKEYYYVTSASLSAPFTRHYEHELRKIRQNESEVLTLAWLQGYLRLSGVDVYRLSYSQMLDAYDEILRTQSQSDIRAINYSLRHIPRYEILPSSSGRAKAYWKKVGE